MPLVSTISWDIESYTKIMKLPKQHRSKYIRDLVNQKTILPSINSITTAIDLGGITLSELEIYATRLLKISQMGT